MRVLCADAVEDSMVSGLREFGLTVDVEAGLTTADLPSAVADYEVLVVRSTKVGREVFESAGSLRLVVRAGSGVNTIDVVAANEHGVGVTNVPGRNAIAVAELTMGLILAIDRSIPAASAELHGGHWDKKRFSQATGLHGRTLGILGFGGIGRAVAERASAFGMRVMTLARPSQDEVGRALVERLGIELVEPHAELIWRSEILTVHVPGGAATTNLIGPAELAALGHRGILINTSRGDVVDEAALLSALDAGLRAGLDVFADEPGLATTEWHSVLATHPNVVCTPHIGASTEQAQQAVAAGVVELVSNFASGRPIKLVSA